MASKAADLMAKLSIGEGTVKPTPNYTGKQDAQILKDAMKGIGTDEQAIIDTLGKRTDAERQQLALTYKTMYGKILKSDLEGELGADLKEIVSILMTPVAEFDAREAARAMKGLGTDEDLLIELLATRDNKGVQELVKSYKSHYSVKLEDDIASETSGDFRNLLVSLTVGNRQETQKPDPAKAKQDAEALYKAGEKRLGTDESVFNSVFVFNSLPHLCMVFDEYKNISDKTIEEAIKSETSGDFEKGLLTIVKIARNRPAYFAEKLYKGMKGLGTDEKTVYRIIITRCDKDMVQIKQEFSKAYGKSLEDFISGDFSGDGKKILLALVGGN